MSANVAYKPDGLDSLLLEEEDIRSYEESKGDVGGIEDLGPIRERMEKVSKYGKKRRKKTMNNYKKGHANKISLTPLKNSSEIYDLIEKELGEL